MKKENKAELYKLEVHVKNGEWSVIKEFGNWDSACGWAYANSHKESMDNEMYWSFAGNDYKVSFPPITY